jgi:hypothetical protein
MEKIRGLCTKMKEIPTREDQYGQIRVTKIKENKKQLKRT